MAPSPPSASSSVSNRPEATGTFSPSHSTRWWKDEAGLRKSKPARFYADRIADRSRHFSSHLWRGVQSPDFFAAALPDGVSGFEFFPGSPPGIRPDRAGRQ